MSFRLYVFGLLERLALLVLSIVLVYRPVPGAALAAAWLAVSLVIWVRPVVGPVVAGYRVGRVAAREGRAVTRAELEAAAGVEPSPPRVPVFASMTPELRARIDDALRERWDRIAARTLDKLEPTAADCASLDCPSAVHLRDALAFAMREADREEQSAMLAELDRS